MNEVSKNRILFDFDKQTSFADAGISIQSWFSHGSETNTWIYGGMTSRLNSDQVKSFPDKAVGIEFTNKSKIISEGETYAIKNENGEIWGVTVVDSRSRIHGGTLDGIEVDYWSLYSGRTNSTPTGTPTLLGSFKVDQSISIDKTPVQDADNFAGYTPAYKINWDVSGDNGGTWSRLTSADATDNNNVYILTSSEVGKNIRGVVSYLDGYGTNEVINSAASAQISSHTPLPPTYSVTQSPTSAVAEGATLTTSVATTGVAKDTSVFWSAGGTNIDADDFTSPLTGSSTVGADGKFSFTHSIKNDNKTEGSESLDIKLFSDSARTQQIGTTASTIITDSSTTPPPPKTYTVTQSPTVTEGANLTTTVATTGVAQNTNFYWSAGGTNIDADDVTSALTGQATVGADGSFSFSHAIKNDTKTEGTETLQVKLFSDNARTTQVGTTASTTVTDTSKTPPIVVTKEDGDAHASVNENLARGAHNLVGMRYEKLVVDGDGTFDSDIDSKSDTSATTGNGSASTTSRHSLLGIELNGSSRIGGEGRFASIVTHESDNEATATNGTADAEEHINSVSVDVSDLAISGRSSFGSYMSVGSTNRSDASQSRAGVLLTDATAILNQDLAPGERNITGMRFERLTTGDRATFSSEIENTIDSSASSDKGDATALSRNSVLGVGFSGNNRIGGDSRVTSILSHNSFNDAQSIHGTATADDHLAVIGVEVDTLTVNGNATFSSTVVVRAGANSGA